MFYSVPLPLPFYPITFPGSKRRSLPHILPKIPKKIKKVCSPFLGTGAVELALAAQGAKVKAYDADPLLIKFWRAIITNPAGLAQEVRSLSPVETHEDFARLVAIVMAGTGQPRERRAAAYYLIIKNTSLGIGMQHLNFTKTKKFNKEKTVLNLASFSAPNLSVARADVFELLELQQTRESFLYLDPPYMSIDRLYNIKYSIPARFNHFRLANILNNREQWVLSYDDHPVIHKLYNRHNIYKINLKYGVTINNKKEAKEGTELLIVSRDIPVPPQEPKLF